jgi:hypothetical protein
VVKGHGFCISVEWGGEGRALFEAVVESLFYHNWEYDERVGSSIERMNL